MNLRSGIFASALVLKCPRNTMLFERWAPTIPIDLEEILQCDLFANTLFKDLTGCWFINVMTASVCVQVWF